MGGKKSHIELIMCLKGNCLLLTVPNKRSLVIIYVLSQVKATTFHVFSVCFDLQVQRYKIFTKTSNKKGEIISPVHEKTDENKKEGGLVCIFFVFFLTFACKF